MPTLTELGQTYEGNLNKYKEAYEKYPLKTLADGTQARDIPADGMKTLADLLTEVETSGKAFQEARLIDDRSKKALGDFDALGESKGKGGAPAGGAAGTEQKSLGTLFAEKAYSDEGAYELRKDAALNLDVDVKTLMQTSAGWVPETTRSGKVVLSAQRRPNVIDLFPGGTIGQVANKYMRETTFTNGATEVAEAAAMPEGALVLTEVNDPVQKIAVLLPVTDEQLEDIDGIKSYIDNRLELMLKLRLDSQLINGSGVSPNVRGLLNVAGIQTQALGADTRFDAAMKLLTKLIDNPGFCNPSGWIFNATDWMNIALTRNTIGEYLLGDPSGEFPKTLWGVDVVQTSALAAGTAIAADFLGYTELLYYRGLEIMITNSNNDDFTKGRQCIRGTVRVVPSVYRSSAVGTLTGL